MSESIGSMLKRMREDKRLTIEDISLAIRLPKDKIRAIEDGDFGVFTADIYLHAFIKKYIQYLGLDYDTVIDQHPVCRVPLKDSRFIFPAEKIHAPTRPAPFLLSWVIICAVVIAGTFLYIKYRNFIYKINYDSRQMSGKHMEVLKNIDISVRIKDITWLRVVADGVLELEGYVKPDKVLQLSAVRNLNIRIGNVYGAELYMPDKQIDVISGNKNGVNEFVFRKIGTNIIFERKN